MSGIEELIGKKCGCVFDLPYLDWPVQTGSPAQVKVLAVDMPMVKMREYYCGRPFWFNVNRIRAITADEGT